MKKRSSIVVATLMAMVLSVLAVTKICRHFSGLEQAEGEIQNAQMPMEVLDALKLADSIGELTRIPVDDYWTERRLADQADEKDGFHSGLSYPGHRQPGSMNITDPNRRLDTSKFGPRLKACEEKWRPILDKNREIGTRRIQAIRELRTAFLAAKVDMKEEDCRQLASNIVERAHLSSVEAIQALR